MIRKGKDHKRSQHENLRGGKGKLEMTHFFEEAESSGTGRIFARATIPPGSSIGEHPHNGEFEIYYLLKGVVQVTDNGKPGILEAGDTMLCKNGDTHSIENKSGQDAEILFLVLYDKR
ncbi:MAG: cupin domain-containing protein [Planctomycetota bacterium]|jgi:quercetin dioxygenase-like cupin family protein|nr:cupin domain-containing protein [Planctomycetota bacterium]